MKSFAQSNILDTFKGYDKVFNLKNIFHVLVTKIIGLLFADLDALCIN